MKVRVKHFASLKPAANRSPVTVDVDPGATVNDLLAILGLDPNEVGVLIVSGKPATFEQELKPDDLVTVIPHIAGG